MSPFSIVLTGGGTGGHVIPALAVAAALHSLAPEVRVYYVGGTGRIEEGLVKSAGLPFTGLRVAPFTGVSLGRRLAAAGALPMALLGAFRLLRRVRARVAVAFGGYVSVAVGLVAPRIGIPLLLQEQNTVPGRTTRLLARRATRVCVGFEPAATRIEHNAILCTGNPVRARIEEVAMAARPNMPPLRLLVTGGSQGAAFLNESGPKAAACVKAAGIDIRVHHQCGRQDPDPVRRAYAQAGIDAEVTPFIDDMAGAYAATHVSLARAGALSVSELWASATPALLIPFPYAAGDHQAGNAQCLTATKGARMLRQSEATPKAVAGALIDLAGAPKDWATHRDLLAGTAPRGGAQRIAREILKLAGAAGGAR